MHVDPPANPYAPPASELDQGLGTAAGGELAERGTRMLAATLDGLVLMVPVLPTAALAIYEAFHLQASLRDATLVGDGSNLLDGPPREMAMVLGLAMGLSLLVVLGILIYQWLLISRTGQSLGKKWTGIRIQRIDGSPVNFGNAVVMRNWLVKLIGAIPYLGLLFQLIDCLFIYREDRRCLHDHMAGTRVVRVQR